MARSLTMVPTLEFTAELWEHSSMPGSWYFVTLPEDCADDIAAITEGGERRGFGSVRVEASMSATSTELSGGRATARSLL